MNACMLEMCACIHVRMHVGLHVHMQNHASYIRQCHIGALIIRIRFWGPLYSTYIKEPPKWSRQLLRPLV